VLCGLETRLLILQTISSRFEFLIDLVEFLLLDRIELDLIKLPQEPWFVETRL